MSLRVAVTFHIARTRGVTRGEGGSLHVMHGRMKLHDNRHFGCSVRLQSPCVCTAGERGDYASRNPS